MWVGRHGVRDAAIILLMFRHGLRTAELVSLKWSQIDLNDGYIEIRRVKHGHDSTHPLRAPELRSLRQIKRDYFIFHHWLLFLFCVVSVGFFTGSVSAGNEISSRDKVSINIFRRIRWI